jgi:hypothetical protein
MTENSKSLEHPQTWRWDEDGNTVAGTYVRMDEASTEYGRKAILVLKVDAAERSVWLFDQAVASKLREQLGQRPGGDFAEGERIEIRRGSEKVESSNGRRYWPYAVNFPDAPKRSASDILGTTNTPAEPTTASEPELPVGDDPLPF